MMQDNGSEAVSCGELEKELAALKRAKVLRAAAIVQDLADSCLALNDVRGAQ